MKEAIANARLNVTIHVARDGEEAILFFEHADADSDAPCPRVVLLDINLPKRQGSDVLKRIRESRRCHDAVVLTVSTSDSARDRQEMAALGSDAYFRKPSDYDSFMKLGDLIRDAMSRGQSE